LSIYKHSSGQIVKTLCGNKADLLEVSNDYVQDEAADKIAGEHQMKYFKTSAFNGDNIEEMIHHTIE
jgi:Ras family